MSNIIDFTKYKKYKEHELQEYLTEDEWDICEESMVEDTELPYELFCRILNYYAERQEIPYGTLKARDGDPYNWVANKLEEIFLET